MPSVVVVVVVGWYISIPMVIQLEKSKMGMQVYMYFTLSDILFASSISYINLWRSKSEETEKSMKEKQSGNLPAF